MSNTIPNKKYEFDETTFEKVDTEEKAYWLGFIVADGYVTKQNLFAIRLKESDIEHLEKFKKFIKSSHPIKKYKAKIKGKEYPACGIYISSKKLVFDLSKFGVVPNKSLTVKYSNLVPTQFVRDYWRGVFDGDGHISFFVDKKRNRTKKRWTVSITGSKKLMNDYRLYVKSIINTDAIVQKRKKSKAYCFSLCGCGNIQILLRTLYSNSLISLDRKLQTVLECLLQRPIRKNLDHMTLDSLYDYYRQFGDWIKVAEEVGVSDRNLFKIRKRLGDIFQKVGGNGKKIELIDGNGNIIKIYDSANDAGLDLNVTPCAIRSVCSGKNKKTKSGLILRYVK